MSLPGRRTAQLELRPFDYFESRRFFPGLDAATCALLYGMVGGIPLYLRQFDPGAPLEENVARVFLDPGSMLYEEPSNLLLQEVSKPATYNAVVSAIANGASQHNEIAQKAYGLDDEMRAEGIMRRLTNNGKTQGMWMEGGKLYLNGDYLKAGTVNAKFIKAGVIKDAKGKFSLNTATNTLTIDLT